MKNILFISCTRVFGGAEYVLCDYIKRNRYNNNMYIYTTDRKEVRNKYINIFPKENTFFSDKMDAISIRKNTLKSIIYIIFNLFYINKLVKRYKIDILYGNNTIDMVIIALYKKYMNKKIKTISHIHDILEAKYIKFFIKNFNIFIDIFIVPSMVTKKSLLSCNIKNEKINVVYNGIDVNEISNSSYLIKNLIDKKYDRRIKLIFVGQFCKRKRPDMFIDIINNLNNKNKKYLGIVIGKVIDREYFNFVKEKNCDDIIFLGELERELILDLYRSIDALILTSDRDPLPTVILEAMSRGTIVIARDVDGVSEIIENNKNGYIFKYDDSVPQIANFIEDIMVKPKNIKEIVKNNAKERIKKFFKLENKIKQINNLLEDD